MKKFFATFFIVGGAFLGSSALALNCTCSQEYRDSEVGSYTATASAPCPAAQNPFAELSCSGAANPGSIRAICRNNVTRDSNTSSASVVGIPSSRSPSCSIQ